MPKRRMLSTAGRVLGGKGSKKSHRSLAGYVLGLARRGRKVRGSKKR